MASQDETTILAQLSNTRAAIDKVVTGISSVGDYTIGGKKVDRSRLLEALTRREERLVAQLDMIPDEEITTMDVEAVSQLGAEDIEYREEPD
jgi:hypothetical protein